MRAAVVTGPRRLTVESVPDPVPGPGELLIRTEIAAICGSDLHSVGDGPAAESRPGWPGHEAVGTVVESRSDAVPVGARVLCTPPAAIAACFAELQVLPDSSVVTLPDGRPEDLVLAQQLGTAVFAMKRFWPQWRQSAPDAAAVVGCGPAGLAFIQLLHRAGCPQIVASDLSSQRLAAAAAYGATTVVQAPDGDIVEVALDLTDCAGVDVAIEAAGTDHTRHQVMWMIRDEGRVGLFGMYEDHGLSTYPFAQVFRRRATIDMTWNAQGEPGLASFVEAVDLLGSAPTGTPTMISHSYELADIAEAFAIAADPQSGALKVAVTFAAG